MDNTEKYNINSLWAMENSFFAQFERVSLPLGGFTLQDCEELYLLIKEHIYSSTPRPLTIAEIGCWTGLSTLVLNLIVNNHGGKIYAIDWFKGSENTNLDFAGECFDIRKIFEKNIKQFDAEKNIEIIESTSVEASEKFDNESLDIIFIDGDHRHRYIKRDIDVWLPKLKKGGLMCGHDCELLLDKGLETLYEAFKDEDMIKTLHLGVCRAVTELGGKKVKSIPPFTYKESMNSGIWYYKKP